MTVTKDQVTAINDYLTPEQMELNALYIYQVLRTGESYAWTNNAIAALLANMQAESGINPGIYESLDSSSSTNGFGLVQWTPNTKYKDWADQNGYVYEDIDAQLRRINYEIELGLQWIETDQYPMNFMQFVYSDLDVSYLTYAFMYNYERPASLDQPHRLEYAAHWLDFLTSNGGGGVTPPNPETQKKGLSLIYQYIATRRRF